MAPSWQQRKNIAEDTLLRIPIILHEVREGSLDSTFIQEQLPVLPTLPDSAYTDPVKVRVVNGDSFALARGIMNRTPQANGKTTVLNLASDELRAGGWTRSLSLTQEEALCYSSTLYPTLKEEYYPWPNTGFGSTAGIYSPAVVIFKDELDHNCTDLPITERRVVSVITVAAPRSPRLTADGEAFKYPWDLDCLRQKIRLVYRMAAYYNQEYLVLGAMGCGAYQCPTREVAQEMKTILLEQEFKGRFKGIAFAVYSAKGNPNYDIFKEVLDGVEV